MLTLGAKPDQIIYANPCKQSSHIRYARDNDVKLLVFDNEEELFKIKKNFPNAKLVFVTVCSCFERIFFFLFFSLVLRIVTDDAASVCQLSVKYGAQIDACRGLIDTAHELGFQMAGIRCVLGVKVCLESKCN